MFGQDGKHNIHQKFADEFNRIVLDFFTEWADPRTELPTLFLIMSDSAKKKTESWLGWTSAHGW